MRFLKKFSLKECIHLTSYAFYPEQKVTSSYVILKMTSYAFYPKKCAALSLACEYNGLAGEDVSEYRHGAGGTVPVLRDCHLKSRRKPSKPGSREGGWGIPRSRHDRVCFGDEQQPDSADQPTSQFGLGKHGRRESHAVQGLRVYRRRQLRLHHAQRNITAPCCIKIEINKEDYRPIFPTSSCILGHKRDLYMNNFLRGG